MRTMMVILVVIGAYFVGVGSVDVSTGEPGAWMGVFLGIFLLAAAMMWAISGLHGTPRVNSASQGRYCVLGRHQGWVWLLEFNQKSQKECKVYQVLETKFSSLDGVHQLEMRSIAVRQLANGDNELFIE